MQFGCNQQCSRQDQHLDIQEFEVPQKKRNSLGLGLDMQSTESKVLLLVMTESLGSFQDFYHHSTQAHMGLTITPT